MDWSTVLPALVGGLVGAGIPATLAYVGLLRGRQSADAEAFGPAVLLLDRVHPDRVTMNINPDPSVEGEKWAQLEKQVDLARERLLVVSAGNPRHRVRELARLAEVKVFNAYNASAWAIGDMQANRDNPEWMDHARKVHSEAAAAMEDLISANFDWHLFGRPPRALIPRRRRRNPPALDSAAAEVPQQREGPDLAGNRASVVRVRPRSRAVRPPG
jgi:hypothetical protein